MEFQMTPLTDAARSLRDLQVALAVHLKSAKAEEDRIRADIRVTAAKLSMASDGIDAGKVALAETVIFVMGDYERAGTDRASVITDAINQLATGVPARAFYSDLWHTCLGTKSYDRWHGQRCDCEYGLGPRHGSIIFRVGLHDAVRRTKSHADLTPDEIEAAVYYLVNIERIQRARRIARETSAA